MLGSQLAQLKLEMDRPSAHRAERIDLCRNAFDDLCSDLVFAVVDVASGAGRPRHVVYRLSLGDKFDELLAALRALDGGACVA